MDWIHFQYTVHLITEQSVTGSCLPDDLSCKIEEAWESCYLVTSTQNPTRFIRTKPEVNEEIYPGKNKSYTNDATGSSEQAFKVFG